jgi:uncharacterized membrane protein
MSDDEGQETLQEQGARYKAARQWQFGRGMVRLIGVLAILLVVFLLLQYGSS